jgi:hypothetical protein
MDNDTILKEAMKMADKVIALRDTMTKAFGEEYDTYHWRLAIAAGLRDSMFTQMTPKGVDKAIFHMIPRGVMENRQLSEIMPNAHPSQYVYVPVKKDSNSYKILTRETAKGIGGLLETCIPVYTVVELMNYLPIISVHTGRDVGDGYRVTCNKWSITTSADTIADALMNMVWELHAKGATWDV